jgi:hypothetical protein
MQDRKVYYKDLSTVPTFKDLSRLVQETHLRVYSYLDARRVWLYPCVDRQPDGELRGIYTNITLTDPALWRRGGRGDGKFAVFEFSIAYRSYEG